MDGEVGQKITGPPLAFCHKLMSVQSWQFSQYDLRGKKRQKEKVGGLLLLNILPITSEDVHMFSDYKETQTVTYLMPFKYHKKKHKG